ncbi:MAG: hypothetical protein H0V82_04155 [Candidatus Protochlamydia sp.]|nr:hypothetical protein [Candidatus Protochlamydia sp.]
MEIYRSNFPAECIFKINKNLSTIKNFLDKRIIAIAIISFGILAACYGAFKYSRKKLASPSVELFQNRTIESTSSTIVSPALNFIESEDIPMTPFNLKCIDNLSDVNSIDFDSLNHSLALQPEILNEKSLGDFANVYYKNVENLEEAEIILLGERHDLLKHKFLEAAFLQEFGKENDVLFLEGFEYKDGIERSSEYPYFHFNFPITKKYQVNGWEKNLLLLEQMIQCSKDAKKMKIEVLNQTKKHELNEENYLDELNLKIDAIIQENFANKQERDGFLISCILKASREHPNKKIFAVCGRGHILGDIPQGFNVFDHLPSDVKCVAIIFKD